MNKKKIIAFQGMLGAYSDLACRSARPDYATLPCVSFDAAFRAVREGQADYAMIPVDNTLAGRVADVHYLMPEGQLFIVGEHFQRIRHCVLGLANSDLSLLSDLYSHVHAIPQCRNFIKENNLISHVCADTATGAADIKKWNDPTKGAIASELAAEIYGLEVLKKDIQDADHNTTRFLILSKNGEPPKWQETTRYLTSIVFEVRNIPAALYKGLGGFATNNVQMDKLESYVDKNFHVARFYADVEGHIDEPSLQRALDELHFFAKKVTVLGTYLAHPFRCGVKAQVTSE
ncbi:MAG: prephenate dehydratase [Desulfotalea sp.]|nr:MAG: prephenate dehydratase [Desulfotalea sp.]